MVSTREQTNFMLDSDDGKDTDCGPLVCETGRLHTFHRTEDFMPVLR
jgi:hypothetical protein